MPEPGVMSTSFSGSCQMVRKNRSGKVARTCRARASMRASIAPSATSRQVWDRLGFQLRNNSRCRPGSRASATCSAVGSSVSSRW